MGAEVHGDGAEARGEAVLAVDYGERRIGLALAVPGRSLVQGLPTIDRKTLRGDVVAAIGRIAGDHGVRRVVLGIPYTMAGEEGPQATEVRAFQARLEEGLRVPVEEWDERLSSEAARRRLREAGYDERAIRQRVDQLSAVLMLESWLRLRASEGPPISSVGAWRRRPDSRDLAAPGAPPHRGPGAPPPSAPDVLPPAARPRRRGRGCGAALALLVLALAALGAFWWASGAPSSEGRPVRIVVEPGTPVRRLARELEAQGMVRSALLFEAWLRLRGDAGSIQAGTYELRRDLDLFALADQLVGGDTVLAAITVPEGLRLEEVALAVARYVAIDSAAFASVAADPALADSLLPDSLTGAPAPTLEGYLFPETYRVDPSVDARSLARVMVGQFWTVFGPSWRARAESLGMTVHQIVTLASIVEEEARVPEERRTIAGVYWNRLARGMALEADPTVQYALGGHRARVLYRDLEVDSPYNTYRNPGLPPGPIASPGRAALEATLYPDSTAYLYFVATGEGGRHAFSETFAEHLRRVAEARTRRESIPAPGP